MPPFCPPALIKMFCVNVSVKLRAENSKLLAAGNRAIAVFRFCEVYSWNRKLKSVSARSLNFAESKHEVLQLRLISDSFFRQSSECPDLYSRKASAICELVASFLCEMVSLSTRTPGTHAALCDCWGPLGSLTVSSFPVVSDTLEREEAPARCQITGVVRKVIASLVNLFDNELEWSPRG